MAFHRKMSKTWRFFEGHVGEFIMLSLLMAFFPKKCQNYKLDTPTHQKFSQTHDVRLPISDYQKRFEIL
jgi:hypothetical protein